MLTSLHATAFTAAGSSGDGIMVIDMGTHVLPRIQGAHLLIQIAVPGLEERARFLPALRSIPVSPGMSRGLRPSLHWRPPHERLSIIPCHDSRSVHTDLVQCSSSQSWCVNMLAKWIKVSCLLGSPCMFCWVHLKHASVGCCHSSRVDDLRSSMLQVNCVPFRLSRCPRGIGQPLGQSFI